jgi:decaprenyl-phosphate phosphoribosyltransferase
MAYCLWAFEKASGRGLLARVDTSVQIGSPVWFELSIVPFVLGILRYAFLLEQGRGGAPEDLVLSDRVLLVLGLLWVIVFASAVHFA